jgi:hypothetical protein
MGAAAYTQDLPSSTLPSPQTLGRASVAVTATAFVEWAQLLTHAVLAMERAEL